jgi:hypothetical protein
MMLSSVIVIEYHSEYAKANTKRNTRMSPVHKESLKEEPESYRKYSVFYLL